jgi:ribosomal small subunit protein bTHX
MGKGDKKSKRGKIIIGSYGVRRSQRNKKAFVAPPKATEIKPKKIVEEPVTIAALEETEEKVVKKTAAKKTTKKTAEGTEPAEKPKTSKAKKATAAEPDATATEEAATAE